MLGSIRWQLELMWELLIEQLGNASAFSTGQRTEPNYCVKGGGRPLSCTANTGGSPGLPLGAASDIHYGQISPYHQLCMVGNTFTATHPADLWGAWCVHLVLQTTEGKLAKIVNGQKRLATCLTTKAGLQESTHVYLRLVSSIEATCRDAASSPNMKSFFVCFWQPTQAREKWHQLAISKVQAVVHGATATGDPAAISGLAEQRTANCRLKAAINLVSGTPNLWGNASQTMVVNS